MLLGRLFIGSFLRSNEVILGGETKLLNGSKAQYRALDEAIRTAQFLRNKVVRFWMDNQKVGKNRLYRSSKELANQFEFAAKLNSTAR